VKEGLAEKVIAKNSEFFYQNKGLKFLEIYEQKLTEETKSCNYLEVK